MKKRNLKPMIVMNLNTNQQSSVLDNKRLHKVHYLLKTYTEEEGEYIENAEIKEAICDTDDMKYIFTDLLEYHAKERLMGLTILSVA